VHVRDHMHKCAQGAGQAKPLGMLIISRRAVTPPKQTIYGIREPNPFARDRAAATRCSPWLIPDWLPSGGSRIREFGTVQHKWATHRQEGTSSALKTRSPLRSGFLLARHETPPLDHRDDEKRYPEQSNRYPDQSNRLRPPRSADRLDSGRKTAVNAE